MEEFTGAVVQAVLEKTVYEKAFISKEAKTAMTIMVKSCHFPCVTLKLSEFCSAKSGTLAELSMSYLQQMTKLLPGEFYGNHKEASVMLIKQQRE